MGMRMSLRVLLEGKCCCRGYVRGDRGYCVAVGRDCCFVTYGKCGIDWIPGVFWVFHGESGEKGARMYERG